MEFYLRNMEGEYEGWATGPDTLADILAGYSGKPIIVHSEDENGYVEVLDGNDAWAGIKYDGSQFEVECVSDSNTKDDVKHFENFFDAHNYASNFIKLNE